MTKTWIAALIFLAAGCTAEVNTAPGQPSPNEAPTPSSEEAPSPEDLSEPTPEPTSEPEQEPSPEPSPEASPAELGKDLERRLALEKQLDVTFGFVDGVEGGDRLRNLVDILTPLVPDLLSLPNLKRINIVRGPVSYSERDGILNVYDYALNKIKGFQERLRTFIKVEVKMRSFERTTGIITAFHCDYYSLEDIGFFDASYSALLENTDLLRSARIDTLTLSGAGTYRYNAGMGALAAPNFLDAADWSMLLSRFTQLHALSAKLGRGLHAIIYYYKNDPLEALPPDLFEMILKRKSRIERLDITDGGQRPVYDAQKQTLLLSTRDAKENMRVVKKIEL